MLFPGYQYFFHQWHREALKFLSACGGAVLPISGRLCIYHLLDLDVDRNLFMTVLFYRCVLPKFYIKKDNIPVLPD